jgi:hypothetical protein
MAGRRDLTVLHQSVLNFAGNLEERLRLAVLHDFPDPAPWARPGSTEAIGR